MRAVRSRIQQLLSLVVAVSAAPLHAQSRPITLDDAVAATLAQGPAVRLAAARADSARGELQIARAIPNPLVASQPGLPFQYSVTEPIDLGPSRLFRTRAAALGLTATRLDAADVARQARFAARQAFYDVLLADSLSSLAGQRVAIIGQILASDSARLRAGDASPREVARTELEFARATTALAAAQADSRRARLVLQLLMGIATPDPTVPVSGALAFVPLTTPDDSAAQAALATRPDVAASTIRVAASRAAHDLARSQWFPTPAVTATYQADAPYDNGTHWALGVALEVPLFSWSGGERTRAAAGERSAETGRDSIMASARAELAAALDTYRVALAQVKRYESGLLDQADTTLAASRYAHQAGAASLLDVLDALQAYLAVRSDHLAAVHDYLVSVAELARATGQDPAP